MPKVSIIIPVYNVEKYLRQCLDSVINQTLKDIEIICINDGSTDNSLQILEEYAQKDNRIKIINKENGGQASARNEGLKHITGELCSFLDSDDYIEPNLYEYAVKIFDNFDIDYFCFSEKSFIDGEGVIQNQQNMDNYIYTKRDGLYNLNFDIALDTAIHVCNKVFKTSTIKKNNIYFPEGLLYEDIYFMWMYSFLSQKAYFEQEYFYMYRLHSGSTMERTTKNPTYKTGIDHLLNWYELYKSISQNIELFLQNYDNLLRLLDMYRFRTKEMVPKEDKYRVELLNLKYYKEITAYKELLSKPLEYRVLERIFSVKNTNDKRHKVITILGIKFKVRRN